MNISVIIPNYNHENFLEKRISSVLAQTVKPYEVIILDDRSSDNSLEIIRKYEKSGQVDSVIVSDFNSGNVFQQWKKGLELAKGDLIWIAESDDFSKVNFLEKLLPFFSNPEVVLAYSRSIDVNEQDEILQLSYSQYEWCDHDFIKPGIKEIEEHLYYKCTIPNVSAVLLKKDAIDFSFFEHNYKLCGDWFFYLKLLQKGKVAYLSTPLNYHRFHKNTVRNSELKNMRLILERVSIIKLIKENCGFSSLTYLRSAYFQIQVFINLISFKNHKPKDIVMIFLRLASISPLFSLFITISLLSRVINRFTLNLGKNK